MRDGHAVLPERLEALFADLAEQGFVPGRVAWVSRRHAAVITAEGQQRSVVSRRLQHEGEASGGEGLPAVGDWVAVRPAEPGGSAVVEEILPRSTTFLRRDPGEATRVQVVAANVDTVFMMHALTRPLKPGRLARELVLAYEGGATPVAVLTKADLVDDPGPSVEAARVVGQELDVRVISNVTGEGIDALACYLEPGMTVALLGPSGVGKSSLVNRLVGAEVRPTGPVRKSDDKGRHVTASRELIALSGGAHVIDTPGMRALGLWEAEGGLSRTFADIQELAAGCRFRDCAHEHEPGCAVIRAAEDGTLPAGRLESYRALGKELDHLASEQEIKARLERKRQDKMLAKSVAEVYRLKGKSRR